MVDATDLKSVDCKVVRVRVPLPPYEAPRVRFNLGTDRGQFNGRFLEFEGTLAMMRFVIN
jgi:hypothetical protein